MIGRLFLTNTFCGKVTLNLETTIQGSAEPGNRLTTDMSISEIDGKDPSTVDSLLL
jgi:hypothetical protein